MSEALKIALILTAVDKASSVFDKSVSKMKGQLTGLQRTQRALSDYGTKAMLYGGIATAAFIKTIDAASESEVATARLSQVYKSMGQNVQEAVKHSTDYASKLQLQIGVEDEAIMAVQSKIATFKHVSDATARMNGHFDRATKLAFDLAATGFGEASGNAVQLGKALEDPIKGITALRKAGITFTDAEKNKIKALVQTGQTAKAQALILTAVEKQVGGVAEATVTPMQKAKIAFGEVEESIGKVLLPAFTKFANYLGEIIPKIQAFIDEHPTLIKWVGGLSVGLLAVGAAMKVISFGIGGIQNAASAISSMARVLMANPIILIIAAIAAAAYLIYDNWEAIKAWFTRLWQGIKDVFNAAVDGIKYYLLNFTPIGLIYKHWNSIKSFFINIWKGAKTAFFAGVNVVKNILLNFTPIGLIYKYWSPMTAWFGKIWDNIKGKFNDTINWIMGLGSRFLEAGKNIIKSIWNGMKAAWNDMKQWFSEKMEDIRAYLPFSPAKKGALRDIHRIKLFETIAAGAKSAPLINAVRNATQGAANYLQNPQSNSFSPSRNSGGNSVIHFSPVIHLNGGATQSDADLLSSQLKRDVLKIIQEQQNRTQRLGFQ